MWSMTYPGRPFGYPVAFSNWFFALPLRTILPSASRSERFVPDVRGVDGGGAVLLLAGVVDEPLPESVAAPGERRSWAFTVVPSLRVYSLT